MLSLIRDHRGFRVISRLGRWFEQLAAGKPRVQPPQVVADANSRSWDLDTDVAVIGFGGAGAAAAIEARDHGAEVTVLERFNGGGSTAISGGIVYAGGGTNIQRQAGIEDSREATHATMRARRGA